MANENANQNTGGNATATATKKATARLKEPMSDRAKYDALPEAEKANFMDAAEQAAFEKLTEGKRAQYGLRLDQQKTNDKLKALRDAEDVERKTKRETQEREKGVKQIISEVRKDELALNREGGLAENTVIAGRIKELGIADGAEAEKVFTRIKTDSVKSASSRLLPARPAYALAHNLVMVKKADLIEPMDGGRPDLTTANNLRKFGFIAPLLVAPALGEDGNPVDGKYRILDGKRRYFVMGDGAEDIYPAVIVTGFPDTATEEKAEVIVNRVRNLNVLATAATLTGMRMRGVEDTEIRRDMGFKTGEIDKITSITDLGADLQEAIKAGAITPTVALSIAKLPKALRGELAKDFKARQKENSNARISEMDVTNVRQARAAEAAKRDGATLSDLAENAPPIEQAPATPPATPPAMKKETVGATSPKVDSAEKKAVDSKAKPAPRDLAKPKK